MPDADVDGHRQDASNRQAVPAVAEVGGGSRGGGKGTGKSAEMAPLNYSFFCTVRLSIRLYRLRARILSRLVDSSKEKEEEGSIGEV